MENDKLNTSDVLEGVVRDNNSDRITLHDLKDALHERGFGILMVIFSFPVAIPLPYPPGFTAVIGLPLLLFSLQMVLGLDSPWLPKWVGEKSVKRSTLATIIEKSAPYLRKIERLSRPRLHFTSSPTGERVIGLFCLLCAISVALPIPLGNAVPSAGILVMALGLLNKDGIMTIIGMIIGGIGLVLSAAVVFFGTEFVMMMLRFMWKWIV